MSARESSRALARVKKDYAIQRVHIGTTAFTNALVERRHLEDAAAIRVGSPVSESLPPMIDWPWDLRHAVNNAAFFVAGGREYDGRRIGQSIVRKFRRWREPSLLKVSAKPR